MSTPDARFNIKATDKTKSAFASVKASMKGLTSSIFSAKTAMVGLAGVAGIGLIVHSSLKAVDAIGKMSKTYGIATVAFVEGTFLYETRGATPSGPPPP